MRSILALVLSIAATQAGAMTTCTFRTECVDEAACGPAEFYLELQPGETPRMSTIFGDLDVVWNVGTSWLAHGLGMTLLLSRYEDGVARASVHMPDVGMIGYAGRCEG
jgi:hypothetical protein